MSSRKLLAVALLLGSCAHGPAVRFADDSGAENTLWLYRPDKVHKGDIECIDLRTLIKSGDVDVEVDENGKTRMTPHAGPKSRVDM